MAEIDRPYFMTNDAWWTYNFNKGIIELTDEAPPKAVESYNAYYKAWQETMEPDELE